MLKMVCICDRCKKQFEAKLAQRISFEYTLSPEKTIQWFHDFIYHKAEIRFVKGRIKFGGSKSGAPFPSMVIIYRQKRGVKSGKD